MGFFGGMWELVKAGGNKLIELGDEINAVKEEQLLKTPDMSDEELKQMYHHPEGKNFAEKCGMQRAAEETLKARGYIISDDSEIFEADNIINCALIEDNSDNNDY